MDLAFVLVLPGLLWVQSWYLLGFYSNGRALGVTAAGVAIVLFGIVLFQDKLPTAVITPQGALLSVSTTVSVFVLMWAVYSALVAGVYLWGLEGRSLGFYSLFLWVSSVIFAAYFFLGGEILDSGEINHVSWLLGVVAILLAVLSAMLFFYLSLRPIGQGEPSSSAMRTVTGWFYMVFSAIVGILGGLLLLGLNPAF